MIQINVILLSIQLIIQFLFLQNLFIYFYFAIFIKSANILKEKCLFVYYMLINQLNQNEQAFSQNKFFDIHQLINQITSLFFNKLLLFLLNQLAFIDFAEKQINKQINKQIICRKDNSLKNQQKIIYCIFFLSQNFIYFLIFLLNSLLLKNILWDYLKTFPLLKILVSDILNAQSDYFLLIICVCLFFLSIALTILIIGY
ncbi:transmembrane protein, putative (macronuclear) [Tetrahymena thermophila SB210]|uniref:Transmembrane protein, putative n=1 Tax=Tetrahymena thermophila (strain SB210) TaxID=312017 RepID=W7X4I0_TETTS|nr:transmembrane protein, putative [Tetrahymena thermophila SB210]EWS72312.1 transmembrane protein, putative [Tetrahymena thermophila SB210]|eukprot:XP_012655146.1 transmembrane protein, putative [Tetrahymena thermophila SB210]